MRLPFLERTKEHATEKGLLPQEQKDQLIGKLRKIKSVLHQEGDEIHSSEPALRLESPQVDISWDSRDKRGKDSYGYNYSGLDIQYPDPEQTVDRYSSARVDFTPFLLSEFSVKQTPLALSAFYLAFDDFLSRLGSVTREDGSELKAPKYLTGVTNEVMMHFLVNKLGFRVIGEEQNETAKKYHIQGELSESRTRLKKVIEEEDWEKLLSLLDKTSIAFFLHRISPRAA